MGIKCLFNGCSFQTQSYQSLTAHIRNQHNLKSQEYYDLFLKKKTEGKCLNCSKDTKFQTVRDGYRVYCSAKCMASCKTIKEKRRTTCTHKYGVLNPSNLPEVRAKISEANKKISKQALEKRKKTNIKKFGVDILLKDKEIKEKIKNTNNKRYGGSPLSCTLVRDKIKKTIYEKYKNIFIKVLDNLNIEMLHVYKSAIADTEFLCKTCNTGFISKVYYLMQGYGTCPNCKVTTRSKAQVALSEYISIVLDLSVIINNRSIISPLELDIYIPGKNIAIEYNGLYWHSEEVIKDKMYHLNKLKLCNEKGIQLIQIFEDEWIFKQDIVKARLKQILNINDTKKIHARKCTIKEINSKIKNEFLEKYHLQDKDTSSIKLGAFYKDELMAIMTFSYGSIAKGSKAKEGIWELNRFCSNYNYHIPGIASKLLTYFKRNYEWKEIFSYADRRWSQGNLYYKLGFKLEKETKPNYWYVKGMKRIHRFTLRKRSCEIKDVPEWILRAKEGYFRLWDCGHLKFREVK